MKGLAKNRRFFTKCNKIVIIKNGEMYNFVCIAHNIASESKLTSLDKVIRRDIIIS